MAFGPSGGCSSVPTSAILAWSLEHLAGGSDSLGLSDSLIPLQGPNHVDAKQHHQTIKQGKQASVSCALVTTACACIIYHNTYIYIYIIL